MPKPNAAYDLERTTEQEVEDVVDALIKRAQEKAAAAAWSKTDDQKALLNQYELISVKALIAYITHTQRLKPETIHSLLEAKFQAANVADIKRQDFDRVIKYMVDLQDSGTLH